MKLLAESVLLNFILLPLIKHRPVGNEYGRTIKAAINLCSVKKKIMYNNVNYATIFLWLALNSYFFFNTIGNFNRKVVKYQ